MSRASRNAGTGFSSTAFTVTAFCSRRRSPSARRRLRSSGRGRWYEAGGQRRTAGSSGRHARGSSAIARLRGRQGRDRAQRRVRTRARARRNIGEGRRSDRDRCAPAGRVGRCGARQECAIAGEAKQSGNAAWLNDPLDCLVTQWARRNDKARQKELSFVTPASDFTLYGAKLRSRLMLGTSQYPSPAILAEAARASGAEVLTVSLRRESARLKEGQDFWRLIRDIGVRVLPNTAGCYSVKEAVTTAQMAREVFGARWIKLEVIGEADTLQPDVFGLVEAARILSAEGFKVFPYTTEDLVVAERLIEAGCKVLMPWGAPIGSGKGLNNVFGLRAMRAHFPEVPLIVDAGLGLPSQAAAAMELGYDGVLLNTAVAKAGDPVAMAGAFGQAIEAGRAAFLAGPMQPRDMAAPSTPVVGRAVLT